LLALVVLAAWNAWRVRCGLWPAIVAPALLVACPFVYAWAPLARVDMLALALAAGGVCVAHWLAGWRGIVGAAVLCTLALWTKQTTATATFAVALAFFLRDWRSAALFLALVALPTALAVDWLDS